MPHIVDSTFSSDAITRTFADINAKELIFSLHLRYNVIITLRRNPMNVGNAVRERILELCRERGITVNKLATMSGITQSTLNNIIES